MRNSELLKLEAELAWQELLGSIEGVSEQLAWAQFTLQPGEYMHTEGSILSVVMHVAGCKFLYGSAAYRDLEVRWRDVTARVGEIWPRWEAAKAYLHEAHGYWLSTWAGEEDFSRPVATFHGGEWPSWKVVGTMAQHDTYHAGQIHLLRATLAPAEVAPPDEVHLWRKYCEPLPSW